MPKPTLLDQLNKLPTYLHVSDIQGLSQLATQGVLGVTGLTESVQGNVYKVVATPFGSLGAKFIDAAPGASGVKRGGITSLVYGSVKGITRLAGGTVNAALTKAAPLITERFGTPASSPEREAVLSAINGVLGDQLLLTANPLTISMSLRHEGQPLLLEKTVLAQRLPQSTGKLLVVLHGLCMNDLQWTSSSYNHADVLAKELGYTPVYLHYNTGLHTSVNGQQFAGLLEQLLQAWPQPIEDLTLLVHSMGGLVSRSACHAADQSGMAWRSKLKNIVFLGTPHHGAPLERVGNWIDTTLGSNRVTKPFAAIGQIRSSGITDLRYGHVLESSWLVNGKEVDRFERSPDSREPLPLPAGVNCFTVAATTSSQASALKDALIGDGLVPLRSALGRHDEARHVLAFEPQNQWTAWGVNHMALLKNLGVTAQLLRWLQV
ncbi:MAG: alpha/beta hydrolase [Chitinophagaceae bacterium]|nr:alpha/beta hydrolase [Polaromonas sp.]